MKENKNTFLNFLTKNENSQNRKTEYFITNNENNLLLPKMKTINNTSRNTLSHFNIKNKNVFKSSKNFSCKTDKNFFIKDNITSRNNMKYQILLRKIKKYNSNENIKSIKNKEKKEEFKDYSTIMKHLEKWDKEHCYENKDKSDTTLLFNNLINYYKNNNLINEEKNLYTIENMLKVKTGFKQFLYNGYLNQKNKLLKELIMRSPTRKKNKKEKEKEIDETKKISSEKKDNEDGFINLLNKKKEDKKINDFLPNQIFKEKVKYEKDLHQKLLFINNLLFNKKYIKEEKKKKLDKIYEENNKLRMDYNDKFSKDIKKYLLMYDEFDYNYKKRVKIINPVSSKNVVRRKSIENNKINTRRKSIEYNKAINLDSHIKAMEYIKNNRISTLNSEMLQKQKRLRTDFIEKFKSLNHEKDILEKEIKIISNELGYYKHVNDEIIREYKNYYMDILKKGTDLRKDGLLWVVKNLIELKINLEYQHFPKYLTHEQIDYLKKLAFITLEENELKIIISVLKKKQSNDIMNDNIERMNLLDALMTDRNSSSSELININDETKELNEKFIKIYQNNKKAFKFNFDKNEEEIKIKKILIQIKKGLYSIEDNISHKKNNFINENQNSILNAFIGKTKDKDLFSLILSIRNRLIELASIKNKIIEKEKENYLDSLKFMGNNSYYDKFSIKEIIRKALFGFSQFDSD